MLGKMRKVLNNGKGFSLVELIVVIAILGILAGIAAPNVIRYIDQSRVKTDISNASIIGNAVIAGIADETIPKADYNTTAKFLVLTGTPSTTDKTAVAITNAIQTAGYPVPKYNSATFFAVNIAINGDVSVGIVAAANATAIATELFPNTGTYPAS